MDRNINAQDSSKLTQFAPLSPEENQPGVGFQLLSKFFSFSKESSVAEPVTSTHSIVASDPPTKPSGNWKQVDNSEQSDTNSVTQFPVNISEGRSLPNVLKRISNLLAQKSTDLQSYKDTDFKQYWMPDSVSRECYDCEEKFTTFRRRHHCRICGQIFCSKCCNQEIPGKIMGCRGDLRVCTYCSKVVLSYLQSSDIGADLSSDLKALQEDLQTKFGSVSSPMISITSSTSNTTCGNSVDNQENSVPRRKLSVGFQEDKFALGRAQGTGYHNVEERCQALQKSASLRTLFEDLCTPNLGITLQTHRYRLRNYHGCFMGSELVDWLLAQNGAGTRVQGTAIGQALIEGGYLDPVAERNFADGYSLYRLRELPPMSPTGSLPSSQSLISRRSSSQDNQDPLWVKQIPQEDSSTTTDSESEQHIMSEHDDTVSIPSSSSTFYLDLNVDNSTVQITRPKPNEEAVESETKSKPKSPQVVSPVHDCSHVGLSSELLMLQSTRNMESGPATGWHKASNLRTENGELETYSRLSSVFKQHQLGLLKQLLNMEGISQTWVDVILPLSEQIVDTIRPDVRNEADEMDIRQYVQFKKVPGGSRSESCKVNGVVCTKNVAHRAMSMRHANPRILLLGCSIVYQRIEGRLMSIEPVMMQEYEYLRHVVARIASLQPDIILVHRSVSRLAQEFLLALRVTLILHVKASVLERVARLTHADIATSVDAHIGRPRLGTCHSFYLKTYPAQRGSPSKTLMFFEGCKFPHLGCTVLLRGAPMNELAKVKRVASQMVFARYNWRLENSFLMDEFARPPSPPADTFFEDETNKTSPVNNEIVVNTSKHPPSTKVVAESDNSPIPQATPQIQSVPVCNEALNENKLNPSIISSTNSNSIIKENNKTLGSCDSTNGTTDTSDKCIERKRKSGIDNSVNVLSSTLYPKIKSLLKDNTNSDDGEVLQEKLQPVRGSSKDKLTSEDKRINVESVSDFSDPLHQYMNLDDEVFVANQQGGPAMQSMAVAELPLSNKFRKALDDTILCVSPFLKFPVPYLETEAGKHCVLRPYFPDEIFWSAQFSLMGPNSNSRSLNGNTTDIMSVINSDNRFRGVKLLPQHPFVSAKLTASVDSNEVQVMLAHFRACGGRITPSEHGHAPSLSVRHISLAEEQTPNGIKDQAQDVLDPSNHQKLAVLFCSYSHNSANAPAFCVSPWVVHMDFYGRNDIPLGSFLERYCFRLTYVCPSDTCETPMLQHIRRFVHDSGCVHIALKQLDRPIQPDNIILMWSWCSKCKLVSPVVPMSSDTWGLSFAKYLELRFHGNSYTRRGPANTVCNHSLHHDHYQYFGFNNIVASFKYTSVAVWEVTLPPPMITISYNPQQQANIIEEIKILALKGYEVYSIVLEKLCSLGHEVEGVAALKQQRSQEHAIFKSCIEEIQLKLTSPTLESKKMEGKMSEKEVQQLLWRIEDSVVHLKFSIAEAVCSWNARIQEFVLYTKKKDEKSRKSTDSGKLMLQSSSHSLESEGVPRIMEDITPFNFTPLTVEEPAISIEPTTQDRDSVHSDSTSRDVDMSEPRSQELKTSSTINKPSDLPNSECSSTMSDTVPCADAPVEEQIDTSPQVSKEEAEHLQVTSTCTPLTPDLSFESPTMEGLEAGLGIQKSWSQQQNEFVVIRHADVPETQQPINQPQPSQPQPSRPQPSQPQPSQHQSIQPQPSQHQSIQPQPSQSHVNPVQTSQIPGSPKIHMRSNSDSQVIMPEETCEGKQLQPSSDKKYVKTILAQLRPSNTTMTPIQNPLSPMEHHLSVNGCAIPTIVYENEPSSIISYALGSLDYRRTLEDIRSKKQPNEQPTQSPGSKRKTGLLQADKDIAADLTNSVESRRSAVLSFLRGSNTNLSVAGQGKSGTLDGVQYSQTVSVGEPSAAETDESKLDNEKGLKGNKSQSNLYIEVQFSDTTTNFLCRVYFAEPFAALRQMVLPVGEEGFIRSLARCVQWAARGGKSGSTFCKTQDDRFILKEMSRLELQLFLEFAPHYFSYVMRCHASKQPTLLGKIVGVFRVVYRNATTNAALRSNLLVMENLFYSRSVTHKFDLKGSVRNRLVNPSEDHQGELVLLDENLLKMTCDSPLYMLPHSKSVLTRAIDNDTQFLASQSVMDYSLLVGLDEEKRELVIGIIDYIRTFTWDKKLETMVKSSGILGGQGKLPTVVSPELYRARFIASMHQYFLPVPDRWTGLGQDLD